MLRTIFQRLNLAAGRARRVLFERKGNVAVITALLLVPTVFALGIGVDYASARQKQSQINGYADAAVLAAVTPKMMSQTPATAQAQVLQVFLAQLNTMSNVNYSQSNVSAVVTDAVVGAGLLKRTATLTYTAQSTNMFAKVIGMQTLPLGGTSQSTNSLSPNINFYMLLDTSPSMEIAATTGGINTMVSNTSAQGGCAFGCHESDPTADNLGNPSNVTCTNGVKSFPKGGEDNFALARCLGVTLRIDLVNQAVQNLMTLAPTVASQNNTTYQAAIYTMDSSLHTLQTMTGNFSAAQTAAANIAPQIVYKNNWRTSSLQDNDTDSYLDTSLSNLNTIMPTPGSGSKNPGDTPQEVVFIVTDAVNDYSGSGGRTYPPLGNSGVCTTIKQRGIRIAVLYLTYNPLPTDNWYNTYIAPEQSQIAPAAQACASPGLFFQVNTDGDVSAALNALFQQAVETAYLSQ